MAAQVKLIGDEIPVFVGVLNVPSWLFRFIKPQSLVQSV
jgi:hypothetical protein